MDYDHARGTIRNGAIMFYGAVTWRQKLISMITRGKYSHVAIAFWSTTDDGTRKLFLVESTTGGRRIVNASAYRHRKTTVVDIGLDWNNVDEYVLDQTGSIKYGYLDFIKLGIKRVLKWIPFTKTEEVCSEMAADVIKYSGVPIDTFVDPNGLYQKLHEIENLIVTKFDIN